MAGQVSKFALLFEVGGNYEDALGKMPGLFNNVSGAAEKMSVNVHDASQAVETAITSMAQISAAGDRVMRGGLAFFEAIGDFTKKGISSIQPLEAMMQRIQGITHTTQESARGIVNNAIQLAEQTPFIAEDVSALAAALAMAKVDLGAFKDGITGANLSIELAAKRGFAKLPQQIVEMGKTMEVTSTSMLADLATVAGIGPDRMKMFVFGMQRALSTGNLRVLDEIPIKFRQAIWETAGNQSKVTAQKAMHNLFGFLSKEGNIGAALAGSSTMTAILTNFQDLPGKLFRNVFGMPGTGGFYDQFKGLMADVYTTLTSTFGDAKFLDAVKEALSPIMVQALKLGRALSQLGKYALEFVKDHPKVLRYVMVFGAIAAGVALVGGFLIKAAAGIGLFMLGIIGLKLTFVTWGAQIGKTFALLGTVGIYVAIIVAALALLYAAYTTNFGGMRDFVDKVILGLGALWEGLSNMTAKTTTLSEETAKALAKAGILDFVLALLSWGNRVYTFFRSVKAGFIEAFHWGPELDLVMGAFNYLSESVKLLFGAIGDVIGGMVGAGSTFQQTSATGEVLGGVVGAIVGGFVDFIKFIAYVIGGVARFASWVIKAATVCQVLFTPIAMIKDAIVGLFEAVMLLLDGDFVGFLKEVGLTLVNMIGKPIQLLMGGINSAMDMLGKDVPASARLFAEKGMRSIFEDTKGVGGNTKLANKALGVFSKPADLSPMLGAAANNNTEMGVPASLSPTMPAPMQPVSNVVPLASQQIRRGANPDQVAAIHQAVQDATVNANAQMQIKAGGSQSVAQAPAPNVDVKVYVDSDHVASKVQQRMERGRARQTGS